MHVGKESYDAGLEDEGDGMGVSGDGVGDGEFDLKMNGN